MSGGTKGDHYDQLENLMDKILVKIFDRVKEILSALHGLLVKADFT